MGSCISCRWLFEPNGCKECIADNHERKNYKPADEECLVWRKYLIKEALKL